MGVCMEGGSAVHVCVHRGWRVYVALNFAASPHLVQLMVDFVKNECSVIVSGVLFHHLMNCDLVSSREEEGRKKVKRKGGRGGRERVGGQGRREEEGGGGRRGKREEEEGGGGERRRRKEEEEGGGGRRREEEGEEKEGGGGEMDWTSCGLQEVKLLVHVQRRMVCG